MAATEATPGAPARRDPARTQPLQACGAANSTKPYKTVQNRTLFTNLSVNPQNVYAPPDTRQIPTLFTNFRIKFTNRTPAANIHALALRDSTGHRPDKTGHPADKNRTLSGQKADKSAKCVRPVNCLSTRAESPKPRKTGQIPTDFHESPHRGRKQARKPPHGRPQ
jgi:hypothetical protein